MSFIKNLKETLDNEFNTSVTENGALGFRTTGKQLMDINFSISSMRNMTEQEITDRYAKAFYEDKLLAVKWLFYASDVRGGIGERRLFRICFLYLAQNHKEIAKAVINLVPEYSRWDNLFGLFDTDLADCVASLIREQLQEDMRNMAEKKSISLLAKWLPSANASSKETKKRARFLISKLNMTEKQYRKTLSALRSYLKVVEVYMSRKAWQEINYAIVPSRANLIYNSAFLRNDEERRKAYLESLKKGETKINAGVLFPHDIVNKYYEASNTPWSRTVKGAEDTTLEELWKALPDYVQGAGNTICVSDGSGSMTISVGGTNIRALDVAQALSIYFSERCTGEFHNNYITFSSNPQFVDLSRASSLREKIEIANRYSEVANTNIEAVFDLILTTAVKNHMTQEEMPKNILILSDMEFDSCVTCGDTKVRYVQKPEPKLFEMFEKKYQSYHYQLPRLVFWNINSRTGTIPVKENKLGAALVSGFSPAVVKMVLSSSIDPYQCLLEQINAERYDAVEQAIKEYI
ncbi:MAG: DUF2828 family protein [Lachnospiraceae bacterium]|nr:DUF2828 family protein [Lachnospiraceae bacterium]